MLVDGGVTENGEFTTRIISSEENFETGDVYGELATNADGLGHEGAGMIVLKSKDSTQFMNSQNGAYDGEIDQYEEAGGFILNRNLP